MTMRGKGHKRVAEKAFKQWQNVHFQQLFDGRFMPTPLHATLRLPVFTAEAASSLSASSMSTNAVLTPAIHLQLSTNHRAVAEWWQTEYNTFLAHADADVDISAVSPPVIAAARVAAHVGPPAAPLGYPAYIAVEAQQWTKGVLRGEAYAYAHADDVSGFPITPPPPPADAPYLTPVRWIQQPLLDGFVAQRLTAHIGVTTGSLLDARRGAAALGRQLPPFDLSPFYAASELLDRWCLFGEPSALLPSTTATGAVGHHRRVAELALAAAILPNYNATWLNGAVVANPRTGKCVFIVGPRSSGKTTLALHCVAPAPPSSNNAEMSSHDLPPPPRDSHGDEHLKLIATEHFFLGAGTPVQRMLRIPPPANSDQGPHVFVCALPHRIKVGIGAVLGTLKPNPALTAVTTLPAFLRTDTGLRAFLANTDRAIWDMSMSYDVALHEVCGSSASTRSSSPWQPAGVSALAGVVVLDWDVNELARTAPAAAIAHTRVRRFPMHDGGLQELLTRGRDYLFRGHYLVRSVFDEAVEGPTRLARLFEEEWAARPPSTDARAPAVHCVEGSVNFDAAMQLVQRLLAA